MALGAVVFIATDAVRLGSCRSSALRTEPPGRSDRTGIQFDPVAESSHVHRWRYSWNGVVDSHRCVACAPALSNHLDSRGVRTVWRRGVKPLRFRSSIRRDSCRDPPGSHAAWGRRMLSAALHPPPRPSRSYGIGLVAISIWHPVRSSADADAFYRDCAGHDSCVATWEPWSESLRDRKLRCCSAADLQCHTGNFRARAVVTVCGAALSISGLVAGAVAIDDAEQR